MSFFSELREEVFDILEKQLPPYLKYHSPEHTSYVLEKATYISSKEEVTGRDLLLVQVAALLHDIGFIEINVGHEERSCQYAHQILTQYPVSAEEIKLIEGMIMSTRIPQQPHTRLERIVADADLEYLGTHRFAEFSQNLYLEFRHFDPTIDLARFNEIQVMFISNHQYHTNFCRRNREGKKKKHLQELIRSIQG